MRTHPHRQQEQLSSGKHTVLTGVPVVFFIVGPTSCMVLPYYLVCICYVSLSVLKIVAAKSEQRDDQDSYKAKLALSDDTQLAYPYTHNTGWDWEGNITSCQTHDQMSSPTWLLPEGVNEGHQYLDGFNYFMCGHVQDCRIYVYRKGE